MQKIIRFVAKEVEVRFMAEGNLMVKCVICLFQESRERRKITGWIHRHKKRLGGDPPSLEIPI
ncbi:MAG: hypothetical protein CMI65_07035, partial [Pedosphaera sp.]|nr:hypothetical protein [Pedosphaera sp.]